MLSEKFDLIKRPTSDFLETAKGKDIMKIAVSGIAGRYSSGLLNSRSHVSNSAQRRFDALSGHAQND